MLNAAGTSASAQGPSCGKSFSRSESETTRESLTCESLTREFPRGSEYQGNRQEVPILRGLEIVRQLSPMRFTLVHRGSPAAGFVRLSGFVLFTRTSQAALPDPSSFDTQAIGKFNLPQFAPFCSAQAAGMSVAEQFFTKE